MAKRRTLFIKAVAIICKTFLKTSAAFKGWNIFVKHCICRYILERKDSLNDMTDSEDENEANLFNESYLHNNMSSQSVDAEAVYIDALQNEVKQLQVSLFELLYTSLISRHRFCNC